MKRFGEYTQLAGPQLWEGPDHLLCIEPASFFLDFSERYRRIDFKNIQAITLVRTQQYYWVAALLLLLLSPFVIAVINMAGDSAELSPQLIACLVAVALLLLALIVHLAKGPTCKLQLQTAVQVLKLRAVKRQRVALRAMSRLSELCLLHQGNEPVSPQQAHAQTAGPTASSSLQSSAYRRPVKPLYPGSWLVTCTLLLLLIVGGMIMADPWVPGLAFSITWISLAAVETVLLCLMLGKVSRYHISGFVPTAGWAGLAIELLTFLIGYIAVAAAGGFTQVGKVKSRTDFNMDGQDLLFDGFSFIANQTAKDLGGSVWAFLILGGSLVVLALLALPAALRPAGNGEPAAPPAPPPLPSEPLVAPLAVELSQPLKDNPPELDSAPTASAGSLPSEQPELPPLPAEPEAPQQPQP